MLVKDVVTLAKFGELSGVAAKDNVEAITAFINLGLIELYKRFIVRTEEQMIPLQDGVTSYPTASNFMYPVEAFGEVPIGSTAETLPIPINDEDSIYSIRFTDWTSVQVPSTIVGSFVAITYVTKPVRLTESQVEDYETELPLPDSLVDALLHYIGYRGHIGIRSDSQSENNAHWARFERSCKKAKELGVATPAESMSMSDRLFERGFT